MRKSMLLGAALAALLLVIGASAFAVWRNARGAQERTSKLHQRHVQAGNALHAIRANVYLAAILTRDYLLDREPMDAREYINQFNLIRTRTETAFLTLEASGLDNDQRLALNQLREEVNAYWDPTEVVLDWTPAEKRAQRAEMLRERVRRRQEVFALAGQVEQMISTNFERERERLRTAEQEFRSSLGWKVEFALVLCGGIALLTLGRLAALERQSQAAESELRLLSGQIRTAQEQERKFLSRELHDEVGQMLTGLRMELASMARLLPDPNGELGARIERSKGTVEQTLRVVRNIAMLLRPSMLDDLGLAPALEWLVKQAARSSGMDVKSDIDPAVDLLPDAHRTCLYRTIQEALTNVGRHSGARSAEVTVKTEGEWVTGAVADDGRGFDATAGRRKGLGLLGIEERVRELGGSVRLTTAAGRGTRVEIRLPRPGSAEVDGDPNPDRGRSRDRSGRIEASA